LAGRDATGSPSLPELLRDRMSNLGSSGSIASSTARGRLVRALLLEADDPGRAVRGRSRANASRRLPLVAFSISWRWTTSTSSAPGGARIPLDRRSAPTATRSSSWAATARGSTAPLTPGRRVHHGDGEKLVPGIADVLRAGLPRSAMLERLAALKGSTSAIHGERAEARTRERSSSPVPRAEGRRGSAAHDDPDAAHRAFGQAPHRGGRGAPRCAASAGRLRDGAAVRIPASSISPSPSAAGLSPRASVSSRPPCRHPRSSRS